jgi:hypothetical protein
MRLPNAFPNQIGHLAVHRFFLNIQCRAKAGTRKKNTITTRSSMKNSSTSLPNSFSSVLKRCVGVPKEKRRAEIEQCEQEADNKCGQEKVPEENYFVAVHATIIYTSDGRSNHKWLRRVDSLQRLKRAASSSVFGFRPF